MRILLIDDEPIALTKLELMLTNVGNCDSAASGVAATERFVKALGDDQPYDLITIDIELPDITGLDLLNRFCLLEKKNGIAPAKKIMVTAHSNVDYVVKARGKCDAFVVKPLRKGTLLEKINELFPPERRPS
ncbi:response regulator [Desulfosarcina alkanivorans]|nr:response regulator [Desulfosarcina alkanivorans]